jgi:hypothetical protein
MILELALATVLGTTKPDVNSLKWMAASEFLDGYDESHERKLNHYHDRALTYFKSLPKAELKKELEPIVLKNGIKTIWGISAAYVLALHGVDISENVKRLRIGGEQAAWDEWQIGTSAPIAIGDVFEKYGDPDAARELMVFSGDAGVGETQSAVLATMFEINPAPFMEVLRKEPKLRPEFVSELVFGDGWNIEGSNPNPPSVSHGIKKLLHIPKWSEDAKRLAQEIAKAKRH